MPPRRSNRHARETPAATPTPTPPIDPAMFQADVTAAVAAAIAPFRGNGNINGVGSGSVANSSNLGKNQGNQRVCSYK